jgi:glycine cleavage system regulatory protein
MNLLLEIWPIVAFMILQSGGALWWASKINNKVDRLEKDMDARSGDGEKIAKMEATLEGMNQKLDLLVQAINNRRRA